MRISDWSSDGCASDLHRVDGREQFPRGGLRPDLRQAPEPLRHADLAGGIDLRGGSPGEVLVFGQGDRSLGPPSAEREFDTGPHEVTQGFPGIVIMPIDHILDGAQAHFRSEEQTSELPPQLRTSYAVFV